VERQYVHPLSQKRIECLAKKNDEESVGENATSSGSSLLGKCCRREGLPTRVETEVEVADQDLAFVQGRVKFDLDCLEVVLGENLGFRKVLCAKDTSVGAGCHDTNVGGWQRICEVRPSSYLYMSS